MAESVQQSKKSHRNSSSHVNEISIVSDFKHGYRNAEDITNLTPGVLVVGSQNMIVNTASRVEVRGGYAVDGIQSTVNGGIISSFDWNSKGNGERHVRAGFLTSAANDGKLQFRYANTLGTLGVTITIASPAVFTTSTNHGLSVGDTVIFATTGSLPTGLTAGTTYYVITAGLTTTAFEVSATSGGSAVNTSGAQSGNKTVTTSKVLWTDLLTALTTVSYNFTTFWDTTELIREILFVNGTNNVFEWSGAYDKVSSVTTNTIVMTNTVATSGWYTLTAAKQHVIVRGIDYTYTGVSGSTLTGVTPDPTVQVAAAIPKSGDLAYQKVVTTAASTFTSGPPAAYTIDLISVLINQIFLGSLISPTYYMSKTNNYSNYAMSAPRIPSDGFTANLDDNVVSFIPQEDVMYITAGKNFIYTQTLTQSTAYNGAAASSITTETAVVKALKIAPQQAPKSQAMTTKFKNFVALVTNEPNIDVLGRIENILGTPQTDNISDAIKNDMDTYDFTNGSVFYWRWYLLIAIPVSGIVRMYNFSTKAWESPQTLPVTRFFTVLGELYGHSSTTSESYRLFTGSSDRVIRGVGSPILCQSNFSYQNYGTRTNLKNANEFYIEGYINANTTLNCEINYELDGCMTTQVFSIDGSDSSVVCIPSDQSSFGKVSFGKEKLGGELATNLTGLPPKFRVIKTFPRIDFYEQQFTFSIFGKDQSFQLLAFGTNSVVSSATNSAIKQ